MLGFMAGADGVNEQMLFHGSARATLDIICHEGFDQRLSRGGLLGSGIYFAECSDYRCRTSLPSAFCYAVLRPCVCLALTQTGAGMLTGANLRQTAAFCPAMLPTL